MQQNKTLDQYANQTQRLSTHAMPLQAPVEFFEPITVPP